MLDNLDFHNVTLYSDEISTISSRDEIDTSTIFCDKKLDIPIIASPMKDVCGSHVAIKLGEMGGFGFIHRFSTIEEQARRFKHVYQYTSNVGCAIGINGDSIERLSELYFVQKCKIFCVDTANAASDNVINFVKRISNTCPDINLVVGNIMSPEVIKHFIEIPNVKGIRVGVAGGFSCRTKNATGLYRPMLSLINMCQIQAYLVGKKDSAQLSIIADGGIHEPSSLCKAFAFGADCVMLGKVIASCIDSPAKIIKKDGKRYKLYNGSASYEIQQLYKSTPKYIEGASTLLPIDDFVEKVVTRYMEGLRSCMSYCNARNIRELNNKVRFTGLNHAEREG